MEEKSVQNGWRLNLVKAEAIFRHHLDNELPWVDCKKKLDDEAWEKVPPASKEIGNLMFNLLNK